MVVTTVDAKKNDCPNDQDGGGVSSSPPSLDGVGMDTPRLLADTTFSINSSRLSSEANHTCVVKRRVTKKTLSGTTYLTRRDFLL